MSEAKTLFAKELAAILAYDDPADDLELSDSDRYILDPARLAEADSVAPVVEAFIDVETTPGVKKSVGQSGPSLFNPLGQTLEKGIRTDAGRQAAKRGVRRAIAAAYMGGIDRFSTADIEMGERTNDEIWRLVITSYRVDALPANGIGEDWIKGSRDFAAMLLLNELRSAGLIGRRRRKTHYNAFFYADFGFLLRLAQLDADFDTRTELMADVIGDSWHYPGDDAALALASDG